MSKSRSIQADAHTVTVHPPLCAWGGGEPLTKFSKREELYRISIFRGGCWERGGDVFQGGLQLFIKNKLNCEIFTDKRNYKQRFFFSVITGN